MTSEMTPRERWEAVINGRKPDRVPMDYWSTPEASEKLIAHLQVNSYWEMIQALDIDLLLLPKPEYIGPNLKPGYDYYQCGHKLVDYGTGAYDEVVDHPLAEFSDINELEENYAWPSPDWFDYGVIPEQIKGKETYPVGIGGTEVFYTYSRLRGIEQAYMDMIDNPEFLRYCLDKITAFDYERTRRMFEQIPDQVMITFIGEDLGSQEGLLFSPDMIESFIFPGMRKMIGLAREAGVTVFTHSDGAIRDIIPSLIEIGTEILNPIQWRCKNMDRKALKRDFGDQLVFHGGMDNQETLPFGSVEDVRQEVIDNLEIFSEGGGYILAPCHNIQAVSPPENIVALYQTGLEYGKY